MRILGFTFTKFFVDKKTTDIRNIKIGNNIDISSIDPVKNDITKEKEDFLAVWFKFNVDYGELAKIELEGNVLVAMPPKEAKEVVKQWKDKKLPDEFKVQIFNLIIRKCDIKALEFESEFNLPPHLQLRSLKKGE